VSSEKFRQINDQKFASGSEQDKSKYLNNKEIAVIEISELVIHKIRNNPKL